MYVEEILTVEEGQEWLRLFERQRGFPDLSSAEKEQLDWDIEDVKGRIKELGGTHS